MRIAASVVNGPRLIYHYFDISDLDKKKKTPDIAKFILNALETN